VNTMATREAIALVTLLAHLGEEDADDLTTQDLDLVATFVGDLQEPIEIVLVAAANMAAAAVKVLAETTGESFEALLQRAGTEFAR
jgi:hypothetical protein